MSGSAPGTDPGPGFGTGCGTGFNAGSGTGANGQMFTTVISVDSPPHISVLLPRHCAVHPVDVFGLPFSSFPHQHAGRVVPPPSIPMIV